MAHQDLATEPLGLKHKKYNNQVKDAIAENKKIHESVFNPSEYDLDNLMKIDVASYNKDVDYILSVMKSKDMLYVSRALKQSKWLVEDQYEHIINPGNLRDHLFPLMTTAAGIKLTKFIRQHLKNETRIEDFFKSETDPQVAAKWLSRCSVHFIENNVKTYLAHIDKTELKRILEKSITIFDVLTKDYNPSRDNVRSILLAASFLVNTTHLGKYLDVVEKVEKYERPSFNAKATATIMNQFPVKIKNNFSVYLKLIDLKTFVKYFKKQEIKDFIYKQTEVGHFRNRVTVENLFKFDVIKIFISRMPKDEQFSFVKDLFIDKAPLQFEEEDIESEMCAKRRICEEVCRSSPNYVWYEFAPFDIAFEEIKKMIHNEPNNQEKSSMLEVLLTCAAGNMKHLQSVLSYYNEKHINNEIQYKDKFISKLVSLTDIHKYDETTWTLLDKILISMDVYIKSDTTEQKCLKIVIIYNLLHNKPIPLIIEEKFTFATFKAYQKKISKVDGDKLFDYLFNYIKKALDSQEIKNQENFDEVITRLDSLLNLLMDWNKTLIDFPFVLNKIKELILLQKDKGWKSNLKEIYNKKKSWRKHMFEESLIMSPTVDVCVNAIKHEPGILARYMDQVEYIRCNDAISLTKLLNKLRIYWPNSLASDWSKSYINRLNTLGNHKSLIRGICTILSQDALDNVINKYAPNEAKIDWNTIDELSLSLQRMIAKHMHIARPQPSPDAILLYAKGDYLQYALPSLLSIFYNLKRIDGKKYVPKLLNAPVSLQKHGLRLAFDKLDHDELKENMSNVWANTKNASIRSVIFKLMFELLCKEKNDSKALELWGLMEVFIDNLNFQEDDKLYEVLPKVSVVPLCVRPKFLVKSHKFLKTLIQDTTKDRTDYEYNVDRLEEYTRQIIDVMPPQFVTEIITNFINDKFFVPEGKYQRHVRSNEGIVSVLSAYLLCVKGEDLQMQRYEELLAPLMKRSLVMWDETYEGTYFIRRNLLEILKSLMNDLKTYVIKEETPVPSKIFQKMDNMLQNLPAPENYVLLTMWKLTVKLAELIEKLPTRNNWDDICLDIALEFGKHCQTYLEKDVTAHFSCIYTLFAKALQMITEQVFSFEIKLKVYEQLISETECVQAYLTALKLYPANYTGCHRSDNADPLKEAILKHPSIEVKMHYYNLFNKYSR